MHRGMTQVCCFLTQTSSQLKSSECPLFQTKLFDCDHLRPWITMKRSIVSKYFWLVPLTSILYLCWRSLLLSYRGSFYFLRCLHGNISDVIRNLAGPCQSALSSIGALPLSRWQIMTFSRLSAFKIIRLIPIILCVHLKCTIIIWREPISFVLVN